MPDQSCPETVFAFWRADDASDWLPSWREAREVPFALPDDPA